MRAFVLTALAMSGAACVKGNPQEPDPDFTDTGGTLAIEGCGYSVTTRFGAEPPRDASDRVGSNPTPKHVHLGLMGDPRTSIVAQWRTEDDDETKATVIRYALGANLTADQLTETRTGITFGYKATGVEIYQVHQAHLCGLQPGSTYSYQVGAEGAFSPVYSFRTAPDVAANPDAEVVFGYLGDSRDGYGVWSMLVAEMQTRAPDLILYSGDAVTVGLTQFEWEEFFERAEPLLARTPFVSAHGNHEVNAVNYYAQIAMPGDQETFGFDYGHAHITVANDSPEDIAFLTGKFRNAIESDLAANQNDRWKLFMHHKPMWSASTRHGSSVVLQDAWGPLIDQYGVDLVLAGHDHDYEVTKPLFDKQPVASPSNGTVYVVAGGAGAELYPNGTLGFTEYSEQTHSGAVIRVRQGSMVMEAFRQDGTAIPTGYSETKP